MLSSWPIKSDVRPLFLEQREDNILNNQLAGGSAPFLCACCHHLLYCGGYTPFTFGAWVSLACSNVLLSAYIAEEVEREVGATFTFEPDIHIGPSAVITLTGSTLATARVMTFYVIVKLQSERVAQLTLDHLTLLFTTLEER